MLISLVVLMQPQVPTPLNRNVARAMHGLLYALVAESDAALAQELHEGIGQKAFTVSPLLGEFERLGERHQAVPGRVYQVRFTAYEPRISAALIRSLDDRQRQGKGLSVRGQTFDLVDAVIDPLTTDGWAGAASHEQLWDAAGDSPAVALEFTTPTAFRVNPERTVADGGKAPELKLLFPLATQVLGSLARKWNSHAPLPMEGIHEACEAGQIVVDRYSLETQVHAYATEIMLPGFVGHCSYRVMNGDAELARKVNALADFARFAGIGQKTTQGMGQARRVTLERRVIARERGGS